MAKYPLRALRTSELPARVPVVLGLNWYSNFDEPEKVGRDYWIGRGDLGPIRGGHAICARPYGVTDLTDWWRFYDQGYEGSCVGFSTSRMMTLLNRKRYGARWLYSEAQLIDEWEDTPPEEGTSVRAACSILQARGHRPIRAGVLGPESAVEGVATYRWALSWDEVRRTLGVPDSQDGVVLLNSWGTYWPHYVRLTDEAGERVLAEGGEACVVTDR